MTPVKIHELLFAMASLPCPCSACISSFSFSNFPPGVLEAFVHCTAFSFHLQASMPDLYPLLHLSRGISRHLGGSHLHTVLPPALAPSWHVRNPPYFPATPAPHLCRAAPTQGSGVRGGAELRKAGTDGFPEVALRRLWEPATWSPCGRRL